MDQIKDTSSEQLKAMLQEALEKEDYEKAARIRDELNRRN
jgi:protein-arginine kinase activator protein McsA